MEGVIEGHKFVLCAGRVNCLANLASKLNCCFVGLATGVADERLGGGVHSAGFESLLNEQTRERQCPGVVVEVGCMNECLGLLLEGTVSHHHQCTNCSQVCI